MASPAPSKTPRIVRLAQTISESVTKINDTLTARGLPEISFDEDTPYQQLPDDVSSARDAVLDATLELHDLLLEPTHLVRQATAVNNSVCIQAIAHWNIAALVPANGTMSFADISRETGLAEHMVRRLLRYAMTMRLFCEPSPGVVAHTSISRFFANPSMTAWARAGCEEAKPAASRMIAALQKWPDSEEPNQTGFTIANGGDKSIYDVVGSDPERGGRFAAAMAVFALSPDFAASHLVDGYDWASLSGPGGEGKPVRVVDVGGGRGNIAIALTKQFPNLSVLVQDMGLVVEGAEAELPAEARGRVSFEAHDLFAPQEAEADVFIYRWILHNWSDKYCVRMLRALVPALKPDTRLVIMETCMPEPGNAEDERAVPLWVERDMRSQDVNMASFFNARERTLSEWKELLAAADPKFILKGATHPVGSALSILDVGWSA